MADLRSNPPTARPGTAGSAGSAGPGPGPASLPAAVTRAATPADLLTALVASDPGRPRITWYDDAEGPTRGERIELSARVLLNWAAKSANLLVDELDVEAGDVVALDLPAHWRTVYWAFAGWWAAAEVEVGPGSRARVLVTDGAPGPDASVASDADRTVVVTLAALARGWAGEPLGDAVDEALEVSQQPDVFVAMTDPSGSELLEAARADAAERGWPPGARVLVSSSSVPDVLRQVLAAFSVDGSVVLVRDPDPEASPSRESTERVTHHT